MSKVTYGSRGGRIHRTTTKGQDKITRSPEEAVRELRKGQGGPADEAAYRERALAIYGLICARCGREFDNAHRHLLTIHHKDGNHLNNPLDGSNWEPLCVYCHEDTHSREILGDYMDGSTGGKESSLVYQEAHQTGWNALGDKLKKVLEDKAK